ncbi:MAG: glycosyltransferase [Limnochordaceae bacterium]|nr:glycosyltransferase [Limnochordaceae bacterium]
MPTSYYQAIPAILDSILAERPRSILDVGMGFGKYGYLCRDILEIPFRRYKKEDWVTRIDGVEACHEYHNPVYDYAYDHVFWGDVTQIVDQLDLYDVVLMIDVLEHFTKSDGYSIIRKLLNHTNKMLLISTPLYPDTQTDYNGNSYEMHKSRWHPLDFHSFDATYQLVPVGDGGAQLIALHTSEATQPITSYDDSFWDTEASRPGPLRVSYILPHQNLTGGLKMLLRQAAELQKRGHSIRMIYKGTATSATPQWAEDSFPDSVVVPPGRSLSSSLADSDVIVAGWIDQLLEIDSATLPILYWEQGSEWFFGDSVGQAPWAVRNHLRECYSRPAALAAVSPIVSEMLRSRYGRIAPVLPNGIDIDRFVPAENNDHAPVVLLVGNPALRFKGFDVAMRALTKVWQLGWKFKVIWIAQQQPRVTVPFDVFCVVNPPQHELPEWYREATLLLSTSWYEGFAMPPLEAMASGLPVVATNSGGISYYAVHGKNVLLAEPGDADGLAAHIITLFKSKSLRKYLGQNARKTSEEFAWPKVAAVAEQLLGKVAAHFSAVARL